MELLKIREDGTYVMTCDTDFPFGTTYDGKKIPTGSVIFKPFVFTTDYNGSNEKFWIRVNKEDAYLMGVDYNKVGYQYYTLPSAIYSNNAPADVVSGSIENFYITSQTETLNNEPFIELKSDKGYNITLPNDDSSVYENVNIVLPKATMDNRGEIVFIQCWERNKIKTMSIFENLSELYNNKVYTEISGGFGLYAYYAFYSDGFSWKPIIVR